MQKNEGIVEKVASRIRRGWIKWREATGVLSDKKVPLKGKGKFYKSIVRLTMVYGSKYWAVT